MVVEKEDDMSDMNICREFDRYEVKIQEILEKIMNDGVR